MRKAFFIFLMIAFLLSEIILTFNRTLGVIFYAALIGIILFDLEEYEHLTHSDKLLVFLAIIPVARISELFIEFGLFWKITIFYLIISFLVMYYTKSFRINPGYTTSKLWFLPISVIIGAYLGYAGNLFFGFEKNIWFLVLIPFIAFSEEILFRGMIQNYSKKEYGSIFAIITTSLLFAIFSFSLGLKFTYFIIIANLIMCLIYDKTENIWLTLPINLFLNLFLFTLTVGTLY